MIRRSIDSFSNIHAHDLPPGPDRVISIEPGDEMDSEGFYSIGIHPWNTPTSQEKMEELRLNAENCSRIVAIGECGLDKLRGAPIEEQLPVFEEQIILASRLGLPLIIHCIRALDHLLRLRKKYPRGRWILHGFRGNAATARQLLAANIELSYGPRRNEEAFEATPPEMRHLETD